MRKQTSTWILVLTVSAALGSAPARADGGDSAMKAALSGVFELGKARSPGTRYFDVVTTMVSIGPDGKRGGTVSLRLKLECTSDNDAAKAGDQYTCRRFVYVKSDGTQVTIPALEGWTYAFKRTPTGLDAQGRVLGIDHARFENLVDSNGDPLGPSRSYLIYNTFIDFHSFCDVFATPVAAGQGIQHLTRVGQRIVHAAAHSSPPTSLSGNIKTGSHFKNGEITLLLKGLGIVDDAPCAIVEFDSGESSFRMNFEPMPGMEVKTVGGSHYFGDIYLDLASGWPRKVDMREFVIARTHVPMPNGATPKTVDSIQERHVVVNAVTKSAFEKDDAPG